MVSIYQQEPAKIIENTPEAYNDYGSNAIAWEEFIISRGDLGALLEGKCLALTVDNDVVIFIYMNPSEVIKDNVSE